MSIDTAQSNTSPDDKCHGSLAATAGNFLSTVGQQTALQGQRTTQLGAAVVIPSLVADALGAPAETLTLFGGLAMAVGSATQSTGLLLQGVGGYMANNSQAVTS